MFPLMNGLIIAVSCESPPVQGLNSAIWNRKSYNIYSARVQGRGPRGGQEPGEPEERDPGGAPRRSQEGPEGTLADSLS